MKNIFKIGDHKQLAFIVQEQDIAAFQGEVVHRVCSTFTLAREIEWATRQFVLEMRESHEEGIGTYLSINHHSPAFVGDEITIISKVADIKNHEIICTFEASVKGRMIATGKTGQKILDRDKIKKIFTPPA